MTPDSHDTLVHLRAEVGDGEPVCLLVGSDAFAGFLDWYRPLDILDLAHLVVMRRPGPVGGAPRPWRICSGSAGAAIHRSSGTRRAGASCFRR